mmetsp:Transcript_23678/g.74459  ORF Transcript_23678/g.74459 Transcript_23678/m.74459 type:complete len:478 (-) Transcript_23678:42-1475(-)
MPAPKQGCPGLQGSPCQWLSLCQPTLGLQEQRQVAEARKRPHVLFPKARPAELDFLAVQRPCLLQQALCLQRQGQFAEARQGHGMAAAQQGHRALQGFAAQRPGLLVPALPIEKPRELASSAQCSRVPAARREAPALQRPAAARLGLLELRQLLQGARELLEARQGLGVSIAAERKPALCGLAQQLRRLLRPTLRQEPLRKVSPRCQCVRVLRPEARPQCRQRLAQEVLGLLQLQAAEVLAERSEQFGCALRSAPGLGKATPAEGVRKRPQRPGLQRPPEDSSPGDHSWPGVWRRPSAARRRLGRFAGRPEAQRWAAARPADAQGDRRRQAQRDARGARDLGLRPAAAARCAVPGGHAAGLERPGGHVPPEHLPEHVAARLHGAAAPERLLEELLHAGRGLWAAAEHLHDVQHHGGSARNGGSLLLVLAPDVAAEELQELRQLRAVGLGDHRDLSQQPGTERVLQQRAAGLGRHLLG